MKVANFFAVSKIEVLEVPTFQVNNEFDFPRIQMLDGAKVSCIEVYSSLDLSFSPSGKPLVNETILKKAFIILDIKGKNLINKYPLINLVKSKNNGIAISFDFIEPDWQKSKILIPNTTGLNVNETFLFAIHYDEPMKDKTC